VGLFARLSNAIVVRKQTRARTLTRRQTVIKPLPLDRQFSRIGGGLTPLAVSSIIREADTGYVSRLVDLGNEARQKDCHLQSLLGTREAALSGLQWKVTPAVAPGEAIASDTDREVASLVGAALRGAEGMGGTSRNFSDVISHLSSAIFFGYAVAEIDWAVSKGMLVPSGFRPVAPRRFIFSQSDGKLRQWDSVMPSSSDGVDLQKAYPDKFMVHQPRINGDVPAREGLIRVLSWASLFRNWTFSDWLRLAELAYKPWRIGRYKTDASTEEIDDLEVALELLTTNGVATFSDRADVNIEWPQRGRGGRPEHRELADYLGAEMSKCVLGQTLTVESGERGARSLGEVHDRVRKDLRENDALAMAATIRRDIIKPVTRLNFGADTMVPGFHFVTDDAVEVGALARAVEGLVRAGLEIPQWWVRDKAGIADPEPGEDVLLGQDALVSEDEDEDDGTEEPSGSQTDDEPSDDDQE